MPALVTLVLLGSGCASKPAPQEVTKAIAEARLPIAQIDRGVLIWLPDQVLFETGKAEFKQELAQPYLDKVARLLTEKTDKKVALEGHTDNVGSAEFNLALSARRAESVRQALLSRGVPQERLETASFGLTQPVAPNDTDVGRALNRRVEVIVLDETVANITRGEPENSFEAAFEKLKQMFGQPIPREIQ